MIQINDIVFKEGEIESINGIEFKHQQIIIHKKLFQNNLNLSSPDEEKKINILQLWINFVTDVKDNFI